MTPTAPRIVIVGGVAGGASAATRARRLNEAAPITLFEKDSHVSFANCGLPYYIGGQIARRDDLLVARPQRLMQRFNIDVRTRHEVLAIDRAARTVTVKDRDRNVTFTQPYDKLILAPGAAPLVPPIEGVKADNVFTLRNVEDTDRIKQRLQAQSPRRAVVVGAGFIGLEMVEQLTHLGLAVSLVELMPQVLPPLDGEMAQLIEAELRRREVDLHLGDGIAGIETEGNVARRVVLKSGLKLDADVVILGIGVRPNVQLAQQAGLTIGDSGGIAVNAVMQTSDPDIYAVGDAVEVTHRISGAGFRAPLAGPANRGGRIAGEHAATGQATPMTPVLGTAVVRVFDKTAAVTGLTVRRATQLKLPHAAVLVQAGHHAGYYPGATPMVLKVVYDPTSGKVLGAQAVGGLGVDKRIDVIATAIHFGGTVDDLAGLDLAYAPMFGSARDPVHVAGFVAQNQRAGRVTLLPPDADLAGMQVVDVRMPSEIEAMPLDVQAAAIPLDDLRRRVGELDRGRPTVVVCASGLRSYNAARILQQSGFARVSSLSGGAGMRRHALASKAAVPVA